MVEEIPEFLWDLFAFGQKAYAREVNAPSGADRIIFDEGVVDPASLESLETGDFLAVSKYQLLVVDI